MRTIFTSQDIKNIIRNIFNGNLAQYKASNGKIAYENPNSEEIVLIDEDDGTRTEKDLAQYLDIRFYSWKNRLIEKSDQSLVDEPQLSTYETWVQSLNFSMKESYGLVELIDEEVTASQDIDSATKIGRITFLVQTDKISNLDYYVSKIRNAYLGNPQDIQNEYGDIIKAYIMIGTLVYDEEPTTIQLGECVQVSCNFRISYLTNALSYNDTEISISLDGDDVYDNDGNIIGESKYLAMPLTKLTWQNIFTSSPLPTTNRPDLTGYVATALSCVKTLTFFDFNKELTLKFNDLMWRYGCYRINGKISSVKDVNIPVFIRIKSNGNTYVFKDMIDNMQKVITNNDFNISSVTLKGWGKSIDDVGDIYLLDFDSAGGSSANSKFVNYGSAIGTLPTPEKVGYDFVGWFIDEQKIDPTTIWLYKQNKTAIAHYNAKTFTLSFDSDGGGQVEQISVKYDSAIGLLENPPTPPIGKDFDGWYINNVKISSNTIWRYLEDKTAVAHWKSQEYVITFNSGDGATPVDPKTVTYGEKVGTLTTPTLRGYNFEGWFIDDGNGNSVQLTENTVWEYTENKTATANWSKGSGTYTLSFNNYESPAIDPITVIYGEKIGTLPNLPIVNGVQSQYWYIDDPSNQITADTVWNYTEDKTAEAFAG